MCWTLWLAVILGLSWLLAYIRAPFAGWIIAISAVLGFITITSDSGYLAAFVLWSTFIMLVACLGVAGIRRRWLSDRILGVFRKIMPSMSQTEREALEAGSVWWESQLFSGRPDWKQFVRFTSPTLTSEEKAFLDGPVDELCRMLDDWRITHTDHDLPQEIWNFIKQHGFFGMIIPKHYGGLEFSALAHSSVVMKVASRSVTAAVTVMVPNSLGPAELLLHYGTDEQKKHYLPRLARGEEVPCFALTSPEAGSDASGIPDTGIVCRDRFDGKEMLGIRLNWDKRYITLGPVATMLGLAFKLYDPDHLLGDREDIGITLALIPTQTPGITIGRRHLPLNMAFQNGPNSGKDVFIPMDWIIGGQKRVGQGWRMLMESLAAGRSISLPALSTGAGKLACRGVGGYARIRRQFRLPIGKFEGVEEALARMAGYTYVMDAARTMTAGAVDLGEKPSVPSAIVKYHLTEYMRKVVNDAMDVQGGAGICMGPRNIMARVYQSIPISITVEGANILTRSLIIFGQGAIRCHPYVFEEMEAAMDADPVRSARDFDTALAGHIGFAISNAARSLFLGLTRAWLSPTPFSGPTRRYYQRLTWMSAAFAITADVTMLLLGGALKRREKLSGRLGDVLAQMYLMSSVLKHFENQGRPADDLPLVEWACQDALHAMQTAFNGVFRNLPSRPVAWLLRLIAFPTGMPFRAPSDELGHRIADLLLQPSTVRDRLTAGIFVSQNPNDAIGRIEDALTKIVAAEAIEKKLRAAAASGRLAGRDIEALAADGLDKGVIDASEAGALHAAELARKDVIRVDDFTADFK